MSIANDLTDILDVYRARLEQAVLRLDATLTDRAEEHDDARRSDLEKGVTLWVPSTTAIEEVSDYVRVEDLVEVVSTVALGDDQLWSTQVALELEEAIHDAMMEWDFTEKPCSVFIAYADSERVRIEGYIRITQRYTIQRLQRAKGAA